MKTDRKIRPTSPFKQNSALWERFAAVNFNHDILKLLLRDSFNDRIVNKWNFVFDAFRQKTETSKSSLSASGHELPSRVSCIRRALAASTSNRLKTCCRASETCVPGDISSKSSLKSFFNLQSLLLSNFNLKQFLPRLLFAFCFSSTI